MSRIRGAESPQPTTPQPLTLLRTPSCKRRRQDRDSDGDVKPVMTSPSKKAKTPRQLPAIPSLQDLDAANIAQEKEWEADWYSWVVCNLWRKDKNFKHPRGTTTIYRKNAMNSFSIKEGELDTLEYQELPNRYNCGNPIRSYKREDVRTLACRKHAMLAGLHKHGLSERELLRRGETLAKKRQLIRCEEHPESKALVPPTPIISTPTSPSFPNMGPGTWRTPIWQGDRIVGSQTTIIQCDPDDQADICDYHEFEYQETV